MSLISKICVLFLGWIIIGMIISVVRIGAIMIKLQLLDPDNESLIDDFLERVCGSMPIINDIRFKGKSTREVDDQISSKFGGNRFTRLMEFLVDWPRSLATVIPPFEEVLQLYKDEYDRGIRTRKEPS